MSQTSKIDDERAIAVQIETYRQGVLHRSPEQIASIWDAQYGDARTFVPFEMGGYLKERDGKTMAQLTCYRFLEGVTPEWPDTRAHSQARLQRKAG